MLVVLSVLHQVNISSMIIHLETIEQFQGELKLSSVCGEPPESESLFFVSNSLDPEVFVNDRYTLLTPDLDRQRTPYKN